MPIAPVADENCYEAHVERHHARPRWGGTKCAGGVRYEQGGGVERKSDTRRLKCLQTQGVEQESNVQANTPLTKHGMAGRECVKERERVCL